jgi:hypothetical protein
MSDDKKKIGNPDRRMVSASEDYELRYFARRHNISHDEARRLVQVHGNDRQTLETAVADRLLAVQCSQKHLAPPRAGLFSLDHPSKSATQPQVK